jgi:ribonuclease HIII
MSICAAEIHIIELLQQNAIDIEVLTNATEKYNKLCEELDILNSYKTIFGIN